MQRLRRQVAFDRLLARLFQAARTTKDIDLTMRSASRSGAKKDHKKNLAVLEKLQEAVAFSSDDFFVYTIGEPIADLDAARMAGRGLLSKPALMAVYSLDFT